jgi:hypothetical protein
MSYTSLVSALTTVLNGLTGTFSTGDVTSGDYRTLDNGHPNLLILLPGAVGDNGTGAYTDNMVWNVLFDLYVSTQGESANGKDQFIAVRDVVITQVKIYPTLNLHDAFVLQTMTSEGDPQEVFDKMGAGPFFTMQRFRVIYAERIPRTTGEFA